MDSSGELPFRSQPSASFAESRSGVRILVICPLARERRQRLQALKADGRQIQQCADLGRALLHLETHHFDLIVADYQLGDGTAEKLLDWLATQQRDETVVIASDTTWLAHALQILRPGMDDWLPLPCHPLHVRKTVDGVLHRIMLERANIEMAQRLRASQRLHRYLVESSPDLIFTLDAEGCFTYVNAHGEQMLGTTRDMLIGQTLLSRVDDQDRRRVEQILDLQRARPEPCFDLELRLLRDDRRARQGHAPINVALHGLPMLRSAQGREVYSGLYGIARDISERKRAEAIINFQTYHDQLTRLPNRRLFLERLQQTLDQRNAATPLAVLFIDVDRFKFINDSYGHAEGDALLRAIAARLGEALRRSDILARLGGDEFAALLLDIKAPDDAERAARKILHTLEAPFSLHSGQFRLTASIGIALSPADGQSADGLTRHADLAMNQVKRSGKNGYRFFAPELNSHHHGRLKLEHDLRTAVANGELELLYQPQVSLRERRIVGVEALLRWNHPMQGTISPDLFIPIAEETGQIGTLSQWVIAQACTQLAQWRQNGHRDVRMSVNLAPHDLEREEILSLTLDTLARHGLPPEMLELEITESMMMRDTASVADNIRALRQHGIGIGIDDFGTGYSALAYLQQLPVSLLKIDRSFVQELGSPMPNPIISAITGIARGFGLKLIAEGVESTEQAQALQGLGCDVMQGYLFSRPAPAQQIESLLSQPMGSAVNAANCGRL